MARGDVVSGLVSIATYAYLTYQPASGVEVLITNFLVPPRHGAGYHFDIELYNGTIFGRFFVIYSDDAATYRDSLDGLSDAKLLVNNARYLRMYNYNADYTQVFGYTGIQTK